MGVTPTLQLPRSRAEVLVFMFVGAMRCDGGGWGDGGGARDSKKDGERRGVLRGSDIIFCRYYDEKQNQNQNAQRYQYY